MKIKLSKIYLAPAFDLSLVCGKQFLLETNHTSYVLRWNKSFFISQVKLELSQILHYNGNVSQMNVCPRLDKIWSFTVHLRRIRDIFMAAAWTDNYLLHILQEAKQNGGQKITTNIFWDIEIPMIILGGFVFFFLTELREHFYANEFLKNSRADFSVILTFLLSFCRESPWNKMTFLFLLEFYSKPFQDFFPE